jgi:rhamnosyltransferase
VRATIAVLTFNARRYLAELLEACRAQDAPFDFEILVIDSGSTDGTVALLSEHPDVRVVEIPNREFGHGRTRNLAARLATGEIVVFLTQDATPAHRGWLAELVAPFEGDARIAAVYGKQVPRPDCCPTVRRDVVRAFRRIGPPHGVVVAESGSGFSNVNSAVRRDVLARIPFRDVGYAEDAALAEDLHQAGLATAYAADAAVLHSHDLPLGAYFRRMYDEARGLRGTGLGGRPNVLRLAAATVVGTLGDWAFVARDSGYDRREKLSWLAKVPLYNVARRTAILLAAIDRLPASVSAALSLDARRRRVVRDLAPASPQ